MQPHFYLFLFCVAAIPCDAISADDWPGFRGDGTSQAPPGEYPVQWSPSENIAWTADLAGYGQSAPVVANGTVYLTAVEGPNKETNHLVALNAATGEQRWTQAFPSSAPAKNTPMIGRAAPTPTADDDGVYAFFESGDLVALLKTGEVRWTRSLTADYGPFTNRHGLGASPAQSAEALYLLVDQQEGGYLLAVNKATGETLWKADRPDRTGWSSPTVAELGGVAQVVVSSGGAVDGYGAASGEPLWSQDGLTGNSIPSPVVVGDCVYVGARLGRQGGDVAAVSRSNCCLRVRRDEGGFTVETDWEAKKVLSHYASPLIVGGSVYYVNNVGVLFRLDAETGQLIDRVRAGRPCWATPVAVGELIYLFGDDGTTTIFETTPKLTAVATNRLWDDAAAPMGESYAIGFQTDGDVLPEKSGGEHSGGIPATAATPAEIQDDRPTIYGVAAAGGAFFVRTGSRLYCVRER